jgi:hypothetical protein
MPWGKCADCEDRCEVRRVVGTNPEGEEITFDFRCIGCRHELRASLKRYGWTNLGTSD